MVSALHIDHAARTILGGGIVAYPTEAVFGLGCLPEQAHAIDRILRLKHRAPAKGLLLIASSFEQVEMFAEVPENEMRSEIQNSWPGPITWILPAKKSTPALVTGGRPSIGIRVTSHPIARRLCERVGSPLVSTSANLSGRPPIKRIWQLRREFGSRVDYVLGGPLGGLEAPTLIRDGRDGRILRSA